jgi:hypothetical protein
MMDDPLLQKYAQVNTVFKDWRAGWTDEVIRLDEFLHDPEVMVPPTIRSIRSEISEQVPAGECVEVIIDLNGVCLTLCSLTSGNVGLADGGQILAEVERRSDGPEVGLLLENLTL